MIITHTSNPAVDYYMMMPHGPAEGVQRVKEAYCLAGGKGLNVSMILHQMGIPSVATTFLGGFTGQYIREFMRQYNFIEMDTVEIDELNRINVKLCSPDGEMDINASGMEISTFCQDRMLEVLEKRLSGKSDWLIISGSLARGIDRKFLKQIAEKTRQKGARLVMDIPEIDVDILVELQPWLIKPNVDELHMLFHDQENCRSIHEMCIELQRRGVKNILLSNGEKGAILYTENQIYHAEHPCLRAVSTTGAGDSMLAAFVGMSEKGYSEAEALAWAAAAGGATAISPGLADMKTMRELRSNVSISSRKQGGYLW